MTALEGDLQTALLRLDHYPSLKKAIDKTHLAGAVAEKYPNGAEIDDQKSEVSDLYTALILSGHPSFQQEGQNQATPDGVLFTIDHALQTLSFSPEAKTALSHKLCNLRTSSLWDTVAELILTEQVAANIGSSYSLEMEYPLDPTTSHAKSGKGKDADVAVIAASGNAILVDAVAPQAIVTGRSVYDQVVSWICLKYDKKFRAHCTRFPNAKVAVVVSLIKNEGFYVGFTGKLLNNRVEKLSSPELDARPGLIIAYAASFRCPSGRRLVFDPIAAYLRTA